jgi:Flp pilus assembly protein TadG
MRIHRDERGQTLILVALSLPILLGFVGFATDVGLLFMDKRQIQTAADSAAIAGALNLNYGSSTSVAAAKAASASNGFTDGSSGVTVTVPSTPTWPSSNYFGKTGYVEATVSKSESTIFLALFGRPTVTVTARAVATNQAAGTGCLYTVGTSGTTFTNNGGITLTAPGCGLVVESSDPEAMDINGNSTVQLGSIGVVGGYTKSGKSGSVTPTPIQNIAPESDPLNFLPQYSLTSSTTGHGNNAVTTYSASCASGYDCSKSPAPSTCASNSSSGYNVPAGATLSPGCYASLNFPSSGTVTLNPGLYLVDGDVNFGSGNVTGSGGVTFYTNGTFNFGSGTYTLSAPNDSSQLYNGVLFAESLDDTNSITFGGNSSTVIKGVVYAPDADFKMAGTPSIHLYADFVVKDITLSGNVSFTSYAALSGVSNPLTTIALVE